MWVDPKMIASGHLSMIWIQLYTVLTTQLKYFDPVVKLSKWHCCFERHYNQPKFITMLPRYVWQSVSDETQSHIFHGLLMGILLGQRTWYKRVSHVRCQVWEQVDSKWRVERKNRGNDIGMTLPWSLGKRPSSGLVSRCGGVIGSLLYNNLCFSLSGSFYSI